MKEIPICIGGKIRIGYESYFPNNTHAIGELETGVAHPFQDDRIGTTITTIRIPENEEVAYERFMSDELVHEAITVKAHEQMSTPQEIISQYSGEELKVPNTKLGVESRSPFPSNNTPIRDKHPVQENKGDSEPTSILHKIIRALKPK